MRISSYWIAALAATTMAGTQVHAAGNALKGGSAGLAINNSGRIELVSSPISYLNRPIESGRRVIDLRVAQPVLCADFAPTPPGNAVGLRITDPNNESTPIMFGGITSFDYLTNGVSNSSFKVSAGSQLACCIMLPALNASCLQGTNGGAIVELLLGNGFENVVTDSVNRNDKGTVANLQISVTGPGFIAPGSAYNYTVVASNVGASAVAGIQIRDWFPKSTGGFNAALSSGSWNCVASGGASCGSGSGTGNIAVNTVALDVGASVTYSVSRVMSASAANGSNFSVSAAVFAPPGANEVNLNNNQSMKAATVQNSIPPSILPIANQPQTGVFLEDTATAPIAFTASDSDSVLTPASFSCSVQDVSLFQNSNCQFSGVEPNFSLVMTPNADANGFSAVNINVTDGFSQATATFQITVTARNDAPTFNLAGNLTRPLGTTGIQQVSSFVTGISTGPANESTQTLIARAVTVDSGGTIFGVGGAPAINYSGSGAAETGSLAFLLSGLPGTAVVRVRMQDSGGTDNGADTLERTFTITVQ